MSQTLLAGYRFETEAQWKSCLFRAADSEAKGGRKGLRPFAPYAGPTARFETKGAYAPAITDMSEVVWRDGEGRLQRLPYGDDVQHAVMAPSAIAKTMRLAATPTKLWAIGEDKSLQAFDADSLTRDFIADLPGLDVLDVASDGQEGVYALVANDDARRIVRIDCAGHVTASFQLAAAPDASALVYLAQSARLVVLASGRSKLHWFDANGFPAFEIAITSIRPCFDVVALGSDGCARLFLAGVDGPPFGGHPQLLTLDSDGNLLGTMKVEETPTGIVADRAHLYVTVKSGLLRFDPATAIPQSSADVEAELISPALRLPDTPDGQRWLRIEATAILPAGCTLEISYASTNDGDFRRELLQLSENSSMPQGQRVEQIRRALDPWRAFSFHGNPARADDATVLSAPLFDVRDMYLWVRVRLIASPGSGIPVLSRLAVLYDGRTLMENLPAIYRRTEAGPEDFLRSLVGVLEATTQTLDEQIRDLGRNIDPETAQDRWLDYIAQWLGLPWDDALSSDQKRQIIRRAPDIARNYGTKAGLEALLESLMPETPRRFQVTDLTADFGIVVLGGEACEGSRLPALLTGLASTATELANKAILGLARLPCPGSESNAAHFVGHVRIDIAASAEEYQAWKEWLRPLIDSMLPATARAELRWLSTSAFGRTMRIEEGLTLGAEPAARLGTDAVTGFARLAGKRGTVLPHHGEGPTLQ